MSALSHELRNPLGAVLAYADLLAQNPELGARAQKQLAGLRRSASRINSIVQDLLDVVAIEEGKLRLEIDLFDGKTILQESLEGLSDLAAKNKIALKLKGFESLPELQGDRARLQRTLEILVTDALRASTTGQTVRLTARKLRAKIEFVLHDERTKLSKSELAALIPRKPATLHASGRWGLFLANQLALAHGGRLIAKGCSAGKGSGLSYCLTLPAAYR